MNETGFMQESLRGPRAFIESLIVPLEKVLKTCWLAVAGLWWREEECRDRPALELDF